MNLQPYTSYHGFSLCLVFRMHAFSLSLTILAFFFLVLSHSSLAPSEFCFVVMVLSHHSCLGNMCQFSWRAYKCHAKRDDLWIKVSAARSLNRLGSALPCSARVATTSINTTMLTHTFTHTCPGCHIFSLINYIWLQQIILLLFFSAVDDNWIW